MSDNVNYDDYELIPSATYHCTGCAFDGNESLCANAPICSSGDGSLAIFKLKEDGDQD